MKVSEITNIDIGMIQVLGKIVSKCFDKEKNSIYAKLYSQVIDPLERLLNTIEQEYLSTIVHNIQEYTKQEEIVSQLPTLGIYPTTLVWSDYNTLVQVIRKYFRFNLPVKGDTSIPILLVPSSMESSELCGVMGVINKKNTFVLVTAEELRDLQNLYKHNIYLNSCINCIVVRIHSDYINQNYLFVPHKTKAYNTLLIAVRKLVGQVITINNKNAIISNEMQNMFTNNVLQIHSKKELQSVFSKNGFLQRIESPLFFEHQLLNIRISLCKQEQQLRILKKQLSNDSSYIGTSEKASSFDALMKEYKILNKNRIDIIKSFIDRFTSTVEATTSDDKLLTIKKVETVTKEYEMALTQSYENNLLTAGKGEQPIYCILELGYLYAQLDEDDKVKRVIENLKGINEEYAILLQSYIDEKKLHITDETKRFIKNLPNIEIISKIKVDLADELTANKDELYSWSKSIRYPITKKQCLVKGQEVLDRDDMRRAVKWLKKAWILGESSTGDILFELYNNKQRYISKEWLENNGVIPANRLFSKSAVEKGNVNINLKIAAIKGDLIAKSNCITLFCKWLENKPKHYEDLILNIVKIHNSLQGTDFYDKHFAEIGELYYSTGNYTSALDYLKKAPIEESYYLLARMYEKGEGIPKNLKKAFKIVESVKSPSIRETIFWKTTRDRLEEKINKQQKAFEAASETRYDENKDYKGTTIEVDSSGCFITTAVCTTLGLGDNCNELNLLRTYRDEYLLSLDKGSIFIDEYYRVAPQIVDRIESTENYVAVYKNIWIQYIQKSCCAIVENKYEKAKKIYIEMLLNLSKRYDVPLRITQDEIDSFINNGNI